MGESGSVKETVIERQEYSSRFALSLCYILLGYRAKLQIREAIYLRDGAYYLCPRCRISLDRDFQVYCDRCGQHLDWTGYRKARVIFSGMKK